MSRLVARILLSIFMFPVASIVYLLTFHLIDDTEVYNFSTTQSNLAASAVTWLGVAIYWWILWRRSVRWTGSRKFWTVSSAIISLIVSAVIGFVIYKLSNSYNGREIASFSGGVLAISLWLMATVLIWAETAIERSLRVSGVTAVTCPACGYNLTGLTEARCPECGAKFTLDELLAAQAPPAVVT